MGADPCVSSQHTRPPNLLRVILPPFALLAIAVGVGLMIVALLLPLTMVLDEFSFLMTLT